MNVLLYILDFHKLRKTSSNQGQLNPSVFCVVYFAINLQQVKQSCQYTCQDFIWHLLLAFVMVRCVHSVWTDIMHSILR